MANLFESAYQGGPAVDVLSASGNQTPALPKLTSHWTKQYDKAVRTNVYAVAQPSPNARLVMPNHDKKMLGLTQRYLVLQLFLPPEDADDLRKQRPLSLELAVSDAAKHRRRLLFSTSFAELKKTPLHARIPLPSVPRGVWVHLALDLVDLVGHSFAGASFARLEALALGAACKLRRIYTLRDAPPPPAGEPDDSALSAWAPKGFELPFGTRSVVHVLTMPSILADAALRRPASADALELACAPPPPSASSSSVGVATRSSHHSRSHSRSSPSAPRGTSQQREARSSIDVAAGSGMPSPVAAPPSPAAAAAVPPPPPAAAAAAANSLSSSVAIEGKLQELEERAARVAALEASFERRFGLRADADVASEATAAATVAPGLASPASPASSPAAALRIDAALAEQQQSAPMSPAIPTCSAAASPQLPPSASPKLAPQPSSPGEAQALAAVASSFSAAVPIALEDCDAHLDGSSPLAQQAADSHLAQQLADSPSGVSATRSPAAAAAAAFPPPPLSEQTRHPSAVAQEEAADRWSLRGDEQSLHPRRGRSPPPSSCEIESDIETISDTVSEIDDPAVDGVSAIDPRVASDADVAAPPYVAEASARGSAAAYNPHAYGASYREAPPWTGAMGCSRADDAADVVAASRQGSWMDGRVFSPPVLTSEMQSLSLAQTSPPRAMANDRASKGRRSISSLTNATRSYATDIDGITLDSLASGAEDAQEETRDEGADLDLMYDPVLDCYFDPKTSKYYELA